MKECVKFNPQIFSHIIANIYDEMDVITVLYMCVCVCVA